MGEIHVNKDDITNIANAIRTQRGESSSKKYKVSQMPTAIGTLIQPSGTINITSNGTTDVANYASANVNVSAVSTNNVYMDSTKQMIGGYGGVELITKIESLGSFPGTSLNSLFYNFSNLTEVGLFNTSNIKNMGNMFSGCLSITTIPSFDTGNVTNVDSMFYNAASLTSIPQLNTAKVTTMRNFFKGCSSLTTVPILSTEKVTNFQNMVSGCSSLTNESLNNILYMLANASVYNGTKTLAYIGINSTQATTCTTLSNWQACVNAGWTTGY